MIYTLGHIYGSHFNPAVSLGFVLSRHFPKSELIFYLIFQFSGAITAGPLSGA